MQASALAGSGKQPSAKLEGNWFLLSNTTEWKLGLYSKVGYFDGEFGVFKVTEEKQQTLTLNFHVNSKVYALAVTFTNDSTITVVTQGRKLVLTNRRTPHSSAVAELWDNLKTRADDTVRLAGYIDRKVRGSQQQMEVVFANSLLGKTTTKVARISADGTFAVSFPVTIPDTEAFIRYNSRFEHFVVGPGDTVTISIWATGEKAEQDGGTVAFGGTLGPLNNEFNAAYKHLHSVDDDTLHKRMVTTANQEEYRGYVLDRKKMEDAVLSAYAQKYTMSRPVNAILSRMTHYKVPNELLRYGVLRNPRNPEPIVPETLQLIYSFATNDSVAYLGGYQYRGFIHEITSLLVRPFFAAPHLRDSIWTADFSFTDALHYFKKYDRSLSDSDILMLDAVADWAPYVKKTPGGFSVNLPLNDTLAQQQLEQRVAYMQKLRNFSTYLLFYCFSLEFDYRFKEIAALYPKSYFRDCLIGHFLSGQVFLTNVLFLDDQLLAYLRSLVYDPENFMVIERESKLHEKELRSDLVEDLLAAPPDENTVLNRIARRHKGKVVYVDLWATWCAPCINQFPHTMALRRELQGRDIVFAYLCADSTPEEWKAVRKKYQLEGDHYLLTRDEVLRLMERYNFNGYPRYMIINRNGGLESANAPRPEMKDGLINQFESLLD
ncbi:TlpA disulfide reductase family protein [Parasegetibacter sp. NRK P23]|uniref:TlpA family protein disulfide reductase n=1 Tax=Parasegetibacter sp. NRK P23 TaxID=2942999 RepID=UPI002043EB23|nr:TlpA disulfide reductase family protein [Parasegetibacter sp. NRK P23]MCM5528432.1 TlpA family protein disulfide reductase [Parasegetibacter sp. NRK P23]